MNNLNTDQQLTTQLDDHSSHLDKRSSSPSRCDDRLLTCSHRAQSRCHQSDMPWLRLSDLSTGPQRLAYLEKALQANPYNKQTLRLIERLDPERAKELAPSLVEGSKDVDIHSHRNYRFGVKMANYDNS